MLLRQAVERELQAVGCRLGAGGRLGVLSLLARDGLLRCTQLRVACTLPSDRPASASMMINETVSEMPRCTRGATRRDTRQHQTMPLRSAHARPILPQLSAAELQSLPPCARAQHWPCLHEPVLHLAEGQRQQQTTASSDGSHPLHGSSVAAAGGLFLPAGPYILLAPAPAL